MQQTMKTVRLALVAFVVAALLAVAIPATASAATVTPKTVKKSDGVYTVAAKQNAANSRTVTVQLKNLKAVKSKGIKTVKIVASMSYNGTQLTKRVKNVPVKKIDKKTGKFTFSAPAYGKYKVEVRYVNKKGKTIHKTTLKNVGVVASEYNIGVFNGSFGPLFFSLSLWDDSVMKGANGKAIPTIIELSRDDSYNWNALPKNVYANPLASSPKKGSFTAKIKRTAAYVADLKQMNKNSKFHFYFADNYVQGIFDLALANKLSESKYDVTLITDGSGSYYWFNGVYGGTNAQSVYDRMAGEYNMMKARWKAGHKVSYKNLKYHINNNVLGMSKYAYVAVNESSNVKWWVSRKSGTFASQDSAFLQSALNTMEEKSMNGMLTSIKDEGHAASFKKLYHFSNDMFSAAVKNGKKVMVLMGSRVTSETNFTEFAAFTKKYYGSGYEYYYKGHPATPTKLYPEKQKQLDSLGIHDLESSIPAELILFFYPDVYVSGMSNSTLNQAYKAGNTKAYFGTRIANKGSIMGGDLFELFFTKITDAYEPEVTDLCAEGHSCFLVEFADTTKADIAIYDYTANTITKYKMVDGAYVAV